MNNPGYQRQGLLPVDELTDPGSLLHPAVANYRNLRNNLQKNYAGSHRQNSPEAALRY
jgi:hypothetical protein